MKRRLLFLSAIFVCLASLLSADDGMWLYNAFPKDKVKAKYGFEPSQQWLDHLRLSSVRFNVGSGSFVSPDGLTFTNHHVGAACVQQISTNGKDYMKSGFYAATQADEPKCPDLELSQLIAIEDVTAKIKAAVNSGMSTAEAGAAQRSAMTNAEKECSTSGLQCDVVTFYSGAVYHLYKYKKYTDVRLVFAPEFSMAFYGGDPDNFTYPRYDLDITFFRVYENGKPAHTENYLRWSKTGVTDNQLIFVSGNPGTTGRLRTVAQLEYLRDVDYPSRLETYARRIALLQTFSAASRENARIAQEDIFGLQNSQKAITGYESGLRDPAFMARKAGDEQKLRAEIDANPKQKAEVGDPWDAISRAMKVQDEIYLPLTFVERSRGFVSDLAQFARILIRVTDEKTKPNQDRLREFRDSNLPSVEQQLFSTAPVYKSLELVLLTNSLDQMQSALGEDNPVVQKVLGDKKPGDVAKALINGTKLDDAAYRKQLYEGGATAVQASTDPMIVMMRSIDPYARAVRKRYEDEVDSVERSEGAKIAKAQFSAHGFTQPPDATFTLRLSYGAVKGYAEDGKPIPYFTQIGGAFQHAAEHDSKPPYQLPESWMNAKSKLNLSTPLNFVSTADIIGGNSGSPTINQQGEVVGIIFDGNIESLPNNFGYTDKQARAVSVDSRGILEALRQVYGATALADELAGPAKSSAGGAH
jgi:hypothetical protein